MTSILNKSSFELVGHLEERGEVPTIANENDKGWTKADWIEAQRKRLDEIFTKGMEMKHD